MTGSFPLQDARRADIIAVKTLLAAARIAHDVLIYARPSHPQRERVGRLLVLQLEAARAAMAQYLDEPEDVEDPF